MLDPLDFENRPSLDALRRKRKLTFLSLLLENITLHGWRMFFWILLFFGLWMLEVPQFFGLPGRLIAFAVFIAGFIFLLRRDVFHFASPDSRHIDRRLEQHSTFLSGAIGLLEDRLANPKKHETRDLWDRAQKQAVKTLGALKIPFPRAFIVRRDPRALRFIAALIFISGFLVAGPEWDSRIWRGILPFSTQVAAKQTTSINLWIKPPDYTGLEQIHITGRSVEEKLTIPQDSALKLRVYSPLGKFLAPSFVNGNVTQPMTYVGEGLYSLDTVIEQGGSMKVTQAFIPRASWPYTYMPDLPPSIAFSEEEKEEEEKAKAPEEIKKPKEFEILPDSSLRFSLTVRDDYSVKDLIVTMSIDESVADFPLGEKFEETRLVMSPPNTDFKIAPTYDMSWHTWAGLPVVFTFEAQDHKLQGAKLGPVRLTLPERKFENPMAKSLIAIRKKLAWAKNFDFLALSQDLESLLSAPSFFKNNPVPYLAIKTASARLYNSDELNEAEKLETAKGVITLLWDTAIALEDGTLALALRDLKEAQQKLEEALRDPETSQEEISRLMDELQGKMANYFSELQKEIQKRMAEGEQFPQVSPDQFGQMISPDSLSAFMEQLHNEMKSGNKEKAQEMLSQLQRMMEMMDPSKGPAQMPPDMQMMSEGINELQELVQRQENLLDQTRNQAEEKSINDVMENNPLSRILPPDRAIMKKFGLGDMPPPPAPGQGQLENKQAQGNEDGGQGPAGDAPSSKAEQEALRYILGQLMMDAGEQMENIPEGMGKAEQEMRGSAQRLGEDNPHDSIPHQEQAIEHLKEAQDEMSKKLQQRMQQMIGIGLSGGMRYDPLGRPYGNENGKNPSDGERVKIPEEAQKKRADEILRILRERSGDFQRPDEELEYYRRLLRQF